jgi:hypothetical protein
MKRFTVSVILLAALAGAACSKSALTAGAAAMDSQATDACAQVKQVVQARTTGSLSATQLRAKVSAIYNAAKTSENPLIRARAVALYADSTVMAAGGEAPNLAADLAAMNNLCTAGGVQPA